MKFNPELYHRRSIRIKDYDYSQEGMYFITICCKDRNNILGVIEDNKVILNQCVNIIKDELIALNKKYKNTNILKYVIMPDHIHFIIELINGNKKTIGDIIKTYKSVASKKIKRINQIDLWQRNYYEHIIRNEKELYRIYNYIENNPVNWKHKNNE